MAEGYFDIQVNGYGGVDFNSDELSGEALHGACAMLRAHGVDAVLATVITERVEIMCARLARLVKLRDSDPVVREVIAGFHIEGPFINETTGYRGAHPADAVIAADVDVAKRLLEAGGGLTRIVTLAPERDAGLRVTRLLADSEIVISAGHCDPSLDQLRAALDAGLTMFTHLGNGCPAQLPRHDNIVQRVLSLADRLWICFIADGVHVPVFALRNYLRCAALERCIVVTDAVAPAGLGPGRYRFARWELVIGPDLAARAPDGSHLIGSAMTMQQNQQNLRDGVGLTNEQCDRLLRVNPRRAIGGR